MNRREAVQSLALLFGGSILEVLHFYQAVKPVLAIAWFFRLKILPT